MDSPHGLQKSATKELALARTCVKKITHLLAERARITNLPTGVQYSITTGRNTLNQLIC